MANGVDPVIDPVQSTRLNSFVGSLNRQSERSQLLQADQPVLTPGDLRNPPVNPEQPTSPRSNLTPAPLMGLKSLSSLYLRPINLVGWGCVRVHESTLTGRGARVVLMECQVRHVPRTEAQKKGPA
jgi:hypothetical protein